MQISPVSFAVVGDHVDSVTPPEPLAAGALSWHLLKSPAMLDRFTPEGEATTLRDGISVLVV